MPDRRSHLVNRRGRGGGRSGTTGTRPRARRGAIVAIVGVLFTGLVAFMALSIDFSRLANLRFELQQAADAGAHGGAMGLAFNDVLYPGRPRLL